MTEDLKRIETVLDERSAPPSGPTGERSPWTIWRTACCT